MKIRSALVTIFILTASLYNPAFCQKLQKDSKAGINVVYGAKHIFTVETPGGWFNDKEKARQLGLSNVFYPVDDTAIKQKSYVYANGYDKSSANDSFATFIEADLNDYRTKYPDFKYGLVNLELTGGIKNGRLYSFSNLADRYREEVLYAETDAAIIVFSFSAPSESDYIKYRPVFDTFIRSFKYHGNDPKSFLEYKRSNDNK